MKAAAQKIVDELAGIKQDEIKPCAICKRGVAHDGNFLFWRLRFDRAALNPGGIHQQHGLEQMVGSPALARIMGTNPDIAKVIEGPLNVWVCEPCVLEKMSHLFGIAESEGAQP